MFVNTINILFGFLGFLLLFFASAQGFLGRLALRVKKVFYMIMIIWHINWQASEFADSGIEPD